MAHYVCLEATPALSRLYDIPKKRLQPSLVFPNRGQAFTAVLVLPLSNFISSHFVPIPPVRVCARVHVCVCEERREKREISTGFCQVRKIRIGLAHGVGAVKGTDLDVTVTAWHKGGPATNTLCQLRSLRLSLRPPHPAPNGRWHAQRPKQGASFFFPACPFPDAHERRNRLGSSSLKWARTSFLLQIAYCNVTVVRKAGRPSASCGWLPPVRGNAGTEGIEAAGAVG